MNTIKLPRVLRAALTFFVFLTFLTNTVTAASVCPTVPASEPTIGQMLLITQAETIDCFFQQLALIRPPSVTPTEKEILLRDVPFVTEQKKDGDKYAKELKQLQSLAEPVFNLHARVGIFDLAVFDHAAPISLNKPGAIIAFSTKLLQVAKTDSARVGIISHELAHEYVFFQVWKAMNAHDDESLRQAELFCDAVAVVTLLKLNLNPDEYIKAVEKICTYSKESIELNSGKYSMPATDQRVEFMYRVCQHFKKKAVAN